MLAIHPVSLAAKHPESDRAASPALSTISIRTAVTPAELEAVYRFRYIVYVEEMRRKQTYADHARRRIVDPLDDGAVNLAAWRGNEIVGVVRLNFTRASCIGEYESFYEMHSVGQDHPLHTSLNTRLMVAPQLRQTRLGLSLAIASYHYAAPRGIKWNFIDCNDHLLPFFLRLGYVPHVPPGEHADYGLVNRLRLNLRDLDHLTKMKSPFAQCLQMLQAPDVGESHEHS